MAAGACRARFAAIETVDSNTKDIYNRWIAAGCHGEMSYLEKYGDVRDNPALLLEGARSMLCCAYAYDMAGMPQHELFADYARGKDYHTVLRKRLAPVAELMEQLVPGSQTRICIDTAPLRERYWAARCGLGTVGRNCQLFVPGVGAAVFLAEILWTHAVEAHKPLAGNACAACGRCVRACPVHALDGMGGMDARRCLSYLTIEYRGNLPENLKLPGRIYGCDICRRVCPLPQPGSKVIEEFHPSAELMALDDESLATLDQNSYNAMFRHSAVKRQKLPQLLRNLKAHCPRREE